MFFDIKNKLKNIRYKQFIATLAVTFSLSTTGMYLSWSSPSIPLLTGEIEGLDFKLSKEEASWVSSCYSLGLCTGFLLVSYPTKIFGRRITLLLAAPLMFLSFVGLTVFKSFIGLVISRIIGGLGASAAFVCSSVYVSEISDKDLRGKLSSSIGVLKQSGNLYVLCVGPFVSYYVLAWTCTVVPTVLFVSLLFLPESPYFLLKKGDAEKARKSLKWFATDVTTDQEIDAKLKYVQIAVDESMRNEGSFKQLFTRDIYRKSLIVVIGIKLLQQLSGITAVESYMETIVEESDSSISPNVSSILFGIVQFCGALSCTPLIDRFGRKPLLYITAIGCAIALIAEGIYFYMDKVLEADTSSFSWFPTTGIVIYLFLTSLGIYSIPFMIMGEFFATNIREKAVATVSFLGSSCAFGITKSYSPLKEAIGIHVVFWIYAAFCLIGATFVIFVVPETKNKTLEEIQVKLNRKLKRNKQAITEEGKTTSEKNQQQ